MIIHHQVIDNEDVVRRAAAADSERYSIAKRCAGVGTLRDLLLRDSADHSGLQRRQLKPIAAIERKLADGIFTNEPADTGVRGVDLWGSRTHFNRFCQSANG